MTSIIIYDENKQDRKGIKWLIENSSIEIDRIEEAKYPHELFTKINRVNRETDQICIILNPKGLTETELHQLSVAKVQFRF